MGDVFRPITTDELDRLVRLLVRDVLGRLGDDEVAQVDGGTGRVGVRGVGVHGCAGPVVVHHAHGRGRYSFGTMRR